jgi:transcriptional regulator with XRE-family HTH domain
MLTLYIRTGPMMQNDEAHPSEGAMTIGENLKRARAAAGLTQQQVWESAGMSESAYKGYEKGERPPPGDKIATLARVLGCSTDELLLSENERSGSAEFRAMWRRIEMLPAEMQEQAKIAMRGVLMSIEQEALRKAS